MTEESENPKAIKRYLEAYFSKRPSFENLLESSHKVLAQYEAREERLRKEADSRKDFVDEEGFKTVVSKSVSALMTAEEDMNFTEDADRLLNGDSKKRKQKEQPTFYKFQRKERKLNEAEELRKKFEEDKKLLAALKSNPVLLQRDKK